MTLPLLPTLFSCTRHIPELQSPASASLVFTGTKSSSEVQGIDIFTFNNDRMMYLDSYQHLEEGLTCDLRSQNGDKFVFACANSCIERYDWAAINSFDAMKGVMAELRHERREAPFMSGSVLVEAGADRAYSLELRRLAGEVVLRSISCDFSGKSYEGQGITDVKVYLTNVSSICAVTSDGPAVPTSIINSGGLDMDDVNCLAEPDLIYQELDRDIDHRIRRTDLRFLCYPNTGTQDGPGTPYTRLVVEGKIDGQTYWWPVNINRGGGTEDGIYRNRQYIFDIMIRNKGTSDPDMVIESEDADIKMTVVPWEEKEDWSVGF